MFGWLTPARRRGVEVLDLGTTPDDVRREAMHDLTRSNALFGGTRAVLGAALAIRRNLPSRIVLADIGTGTGDIAQTLSDAIRAKGHAVDVVGVDRSEALARAAQPLLSGVLAGDALLIPLGTRSADLVICSQVLHHFVGEDARRLVAELNRVSRGWVIVADLRRSWLPLVGFWIASLALRFHPVTRQDGVTSVRRGFTPKELDALVREVTGAHPRIDRRAFWRLTATWRATSDRLKGS